MGKRGQMKLSFGMIFSIILIIIFIGITFYAVIKFLEFQDTVKISQFQNNLQTDIDKMWKSSQGSQEVEYSLPTNIDAVCFLDDEYENLVYRSDDVLGGTNMDHIDIDKILDGKDSFCVINIKGKIKMVIKKDYGEALVTIMQME